MNLEDIIIILIMLVPLGFMIFVILFMTIAHDCKEGDVVDTFVREGKIYLECGNKDIIEKYKVIEGKQIVEKSRLVKKENLHIEEYKANWIDKLASIENIFPLWCVTSVFCAVVGTGWNTSRRRTR